MNSNRFFFAILALTVCAGLANAQNIHPDISSQLVKVTVDPSVIKGPIKPMNSVNNGPNVGDDPQQILTDAYLKMMLTLLKYQHENGMWGQVIDNPEFWDESSCTAMFAYAFVEGIRLGLLDEATYGPAARKAWVSCAGCWMNMPILPRSASLISSRGCALSIA